MSEEDVLDTFKEFDEISSNIAKEFFPRNNEPQSQLNEEGISDTEESDSRKTSESKERKQEPEEDLEFLP